MTRHQHRRSRLAAGVGLAILAAACSQSGGQASKQETAETETGGGRSGSTPPRNMVVTSFDTASAKFAPLEPNAPDGPQISVLWGDYRTGPSTSLFRFPRGYGGRFHTHSADYHLSLLDGTMKHWDANGSEAAARPLGRGAYWYQPAGQVHSDQCLSEYCIAFVKFEGPIDADYVNPPK